MASSMTSSPAGLCSKQRRETATTTTIFSQAPELGRPLDTERRRRFADLVSQGPRIGFVAETGKRTIYLLSCVSCFLLLSRYPGTVRDRCMLRM